MSPITWTPDAVSSNCRPCAASVWRMVESQHVASTMKLVDTLAEQDILESILEESKPPLPLDVTGLDYLLASPFRYVPYPPGSRFRSQTDPGVFYGSETVRTSAAEIGYWRWRFLQETAGLDRLGPAAHTAFSVSVEARGIDLRVSPFEVDAGIWVHPSDYSGTQELARFAREARVEVIFYRSVRDPEPGMCVAVLSPRAFSSPRHDPATQTWQLVVTKNEAIWRRGNGEKFSFPSSFWL